MRRRTRCLLHVDRLLAQPTNVFLKGRALRARFQVERFEKAH